MGGPPTGRLPSSPAPRGDGRRAPVPRLDGGGSQHEPAGRQPWPQERGRGPEDTAGLSLPCVPEACLASPAPSRPLPNLTPRLLSSRLTAHRSGRAVVSFLQNPGSELPSGAEHPPALPQTVTGQGLQEGGRGSAGPLGVTRPSRAFLQEQSGWHGLPCTPPPPALAPRFQRPFGPAPGCDAIFPPSAPSRPPRLELQTSPPLRDHSSSPACTGSPRPCRVHGTPTDSLFK